MTQVLSCELYQALADRYENPRNRRFYQSIASLLPLGLPRLCSGFALDLGCGSGLSTEILVPAFPHLRWEGLDGSEKMLRIAQSKQRLNEVSFTLGMAESLPFPDHHFSLVTCNFAFHWFQQTALDEIKRVLRPQGFFVMTVPLLGSSSQLNGNILLRDAIFLNRSSIKRSNTQGITLRSLSRLMWRWNIIRLEERSFQEMFESAVEFWQSLEQRGSIAAIFEGNSTTCELIKLPDLNPLSPLHFDWRFALVQAVPS